MEWLLENSLAVFVGMGISGLIALITHKNKYQELAKKIDIIAKYFSNSNKEPKESIYNKLQNSSSEEKRKFTLNDCVVSLCEIAFLMYITGFILILLVYVISPLIKKLFLFWGGG